ncbi:NAD(P)/FAD-dependent oxidoreductase [Candidatus Woesearchaeota archaeon]|nr:NAD(P)/FAD-dependent oxidoreductase [Candidatus Woesearchaeota archaeon]
MKKHSTGALTKEQHKKQDTMYAQGHAYDYVIIGTGMSALTVGSLLAHSGKKVCMLEAHDVPGGMAHSFKMGDYTFCAQVHYIWGCAPGGRIHEFLRRIGLEKDITFELLGPAGYDRMVMPDGKKVMIPYGFDKLADNIDAAYPGQREKVLHFTSILDRIRTELRNLPERNIRWWEKFTKGWQFRTLLKYKNRTLQDVFDECHLSREAQAVLIANAGDMMAPPKDLSIFCYAGLFGGYNTGAYYPTKHFSHFTERLAEFITSHDGCHIYYETSVTNIDTLEGRVVGVKTADGKRFTADKYICNMDPQKASYLIGREKFPDSFLPALSYKYSPSGVMVYLGLSGIDLKKYGFGSFNTWHLEQWDMNQMWLEQGQHQFDHPWIFISTPTLHTSSGGTAPRSGHIMEIATYTEYEPFKKLQEKSYQDYVHEKSRIGNLLIDYVEKKYVPDLRKHIKVKVIGTPVTHEDYCNAPMGNAYGSYLDPAHIGLSRLKAKTPFPNLWWCNASSGYGGVHGTVSTGMQLYMDLTGDAFYDFSKAPTDEELIAQLPKKWRA